MSYRSARLRAGDLRQTLALYAANNTVNAYGERGGAPILQATVAGNLWAAAAPDSKENLSEQSDSAVTRATATLRAPGVTPLVGWSLICDGLEWQVKGVRDPVGVKDAWELDLVRRVEA